MHDPHDLTDARPDGAEASFEARLRSARAVPPPLDRDRLMYLAGKRSAEARPPRRFWPFLTAASWLTCAAVVGLLSTRPPKVVTQIRTVERVIEVPIEVAPQSPSAIAVSPRPEEARPPSRGSLPDLLPFPLDGRPLTILSSRPALLDRTAPLVVAEAPPLQIDSAARPQPPASYAELRRELLPNASDEPTAFRWF